MRASSTFVEVKTIAGGLGRLSETSILSEAKAKTMKQLGETLSLAAKTTTCLPLIRTKFFTKISGNSDQNWPKTVPNELWEWKPWLYLSIASKIGMKSSEPKTDENQLTGKSKQWKVSGKRLKIEPKNSGNRAKQGFWAKPKQRRWNNERLSELKGASSLSGGMGFLLNPCF